MKFPFANPAYTYRMTVQCKQAYEAFPFVSSTAHPMEYLSYIQWDYAALIYNDFLSRMHG
jgi:hypothetical protein